MRAVPEQISAKAGAAEEVVVLRHVPWEGLGAFAAGLEEWEIGWRYVDLFAGEPVPDLYAARAVFVMGGPMGVYDGGRYPFLSRELNAIREAVRENVPTLGVCPTWTCAWGRSSWPVPWAQRSAPICSDRRSGGDRNSVARGGG